METKKWQPDYSWIPQMDCSKTYIFEWVSYETGNSFISSNIKFDTQDRWIEYFKNELQWYFFECFWTAEEWEAKIEESLNCR
jgi:hypothetical protein